MQTLDIYTLPEIVTGKRYYIKFEYAHPTTGVYKLFRISNSAKHGQINRIKDIEVRYNCLLDLQLEYISKLEHGWVPDCFAHLPKPKTAKTPNTIILAIDKVIELRATTMADTSYPSFANQLNTFKNWLRAHQLHILQPHEITEAHIYDFLMYCMVKRGCKSRTRNNYLNTLIATFKEIKKFNPKCALNPCANIGKLRNKSEQHRLHRPEDLATIMPWMQQNDPYLYEFCRFFVYLGCRPIEATRVKIKDINLNNRTVEFLQKNEKTETRKVKRIFDTHLVDFAKYDLENLPGNWYLFTSEGKPGPNRANRDWFTSHFERVKKRFNLPANQTMYALRHTFMVSLFKNCKSFEELSDVMKITGHKTIQAFQVYIQTYLDEPTKDLSHLMKNTMF